MTDIRQTLAAWARGRMVPLETYYRFHGMLIGPSAARECCDSFARGTILFMPSSYRLGENDERGKSRAGARLSRWDASGVTVSRYFLLVVLSFTGLSTLLGLTETIDARELRERGSGVNSFTGQVPAPISACRFRKRQRGTFRRPMAHTR